jgi:hypothetical protein
MNILNHLGIWGLKEEEAATMGWQRKQSRLAEALPHPPLHTHTHTHTHTQVAIGVSGMGVTGEGYL